MKTIYTLGFLLLFHWTWAQNSCENAIEITDSGIYTIELIDGNPPTSICISGATTQSHGEWYSYTPTINTNLTISSDLSQNVGGDTRFHLYQGDCSNLECIGGDDDTGSGYLSKTTIPVIAGTTYYIVWDNRWSSDGFDFELNTGDETAEAFNFTIDATGTIGSFDNAVVDMNGDYLDDIVALNNGNLVIYAQNADGTFTFSEYPLSGLNTVPSWSMAAGDLNGDGFNDLVFGGGSSVSFVFSESGQYIPINFSDYVFSQRSNCIDINNDGHLDAFVCHDVQPNVYFMNDGNNNLSFNQGGLGDTPNGGNYGSIWIDYDNDGDMDLFIAKCRGGDSEANLDQLHRNNGDGTFTDVSIESNLQDNIQTWSSAWGDYDNDGDMDVVVGANSFANGGHKLKANNGDGTFTNVTNGSNWEMLNAGGREFITHDFDNDGFLDILSSVGGGNLMFNNGDMTFTNTATNVAFGPVGDLNNDGFLDVYWNEIKYINNGNENHWVKFNMQGVASNSNGIGARIEIYGDWGVQIREIRSGDGFAYMSTLNAHFGLGQSTAINSLVVKWPSGAIDTYENIAIDTTHLLTEGETLGVEDLEQIETIITIAPNPVKDVLSVFTDQEIKMLKIYDNQGKLVLQSEQNETQVSQLTSGIYRVECVLANEEVHYLSFIKE